MRRSSKIDKQVGDDRDNYIRFFSGKDGKKKKGNKEQTKKFFLRVRKKKKK